MTTRLGVFIAESLSPSDFYEWQLDGFAANEVLRIQDRLTQYRIVLTRALLKRAIHEAAAGSFRIFHLSCHGDRDGIRLTDGDDVDWLSLAHMLWPLAADDRCVVMASCGGGHFDFTKALLKANSKFGYVFGSTHKDGIGFADSCLAWSVLYRDLIENGFGKETFKKAVNTINKIAPGEFLYRRLDGSLYRRFPPQ
jgi:hypothetical protein